MKGNTEVVMKLNISKLVEEYFTALQTPSKLSSSRNFMNFLVIIVKKTNNSK